MFGTHLSENLMFGVISVVTACTEPAVITAFARRGIESWAIEYPSHHYHHYHLQRRRWGAVESDCECCIIVVCQATQRVRSTNCIPTNSKNNVASINPFVVQWRLLSAESSVWPTARGVANPDAEEMSIADSSNYAPIHQIFALLWALS